MVGRPLRPPTPLRLRPNGGLDRPRADRRVRPRARRGRVSSPAHPTPVVEQRSSWVLAPPEGANPDFCTAGRWHLWSGPARGTLSSGRSPNPLLAAPPPPLLDRYYGSATSLDRF